MTKHYLVCGAGLSGATCARILAERGHCIDVIDKNNYVAGNCHDYWEHGILVSTHGMHVFHTDNEKVWRFVNRFGAWKTYYHKVVAYVRGKYVPLPIGLETVNALYDLSLRDENELEKFLFPQRIYTPEIKTSRDYLVSKIGYDLYNAFYKHYNFKQWHKYPQDLHYSVAKRLPIRSDWNNNYFSHRYQALPMRGYTRFVQEMLDHPNIRVQLNTDFFSRRFNYEKMIYTGPIDGFYADRGYDKLEYRSILFDKRIYNNPGFHQSFVVINYPTMEVHDKVTRSIEYKHLSGHDSDKTIVVTETTVDHGNPDYPVPCDRNHLLYEKYKTLADAEKDVYFTGRAATYTYLNMDQAIAESLKLCEKLLKE